MTAAKVVACAVQFDPSAKVILRKTFARKPVIGILKDNKSLGSVFTKCCVDIFASHLHRCTMKSERIDCVQSVNDKVNIEQVECTKI